MEILENRTAIAVKLCTASHSFQEKFVQKFVQIARAGLDVFASGDASNALGWWAPQILAGDLVRWPYLLVPTAPIDERDIAAVSVRAYARTDTPGRNMF
jgi:hypothetical protein